VGVHSALADACIHQHVLQLLVASRGRLSVRRRVVVLLQPSAVSASPLVAQSCHLLTLRKKGTKQPGSVPASRLPCPLPLPWPSQGVLCDNLLAANWSPGALSQLAILGNSFATYHTRWSGPPNLRPSTTRPDRLLQLVEAGEA
jgi:hypothetical protein